MNTFNLINKKAKIPSKIAQNPLKSLYFHPSSAHPDILTDRIGIFFQIKKDYQIKGGNKNGKI